MSEDNGTTPVATPIDAVPPTMMEIYARAVDKGFDAEQLERIAKLQIWLEEQRAKKAYTVAMNKVQREMTTVFKEEENESTRSRYAPMEAIQAMAKPVYTRHGFALTFATLPTSTPNVYHVYADVLHEEGHVERHFLHDVPNDSAGPKGGATKSQVQGLVSAMTYAKRNLLASIFNIVVAGQDKDGNARRHTLGAEEIKQVQDAMAACQAAGAPVDYAKFMEWAAPGAKLLNDIPLRRLDMILNFLQKRLNQFKPEGQR
jgi:hypothetical protein